MLSVMEDVRLAHASIMEDVRLAHASIMEDVRLAHAKCNGGCKVSTC